MPIPLIPLGLAGLAAAGKNLLSNKGNTLPIPRPRPQPKPLHIGQDNIPIQNPIQNLVKGLSTSMSGLSSTLTSLTSSVTRLIQKPPTEDYNAVVKNFLPENAVLLTPQYPANTERFQMIDLDGDSQNELVATYRSGNEINTLILKKSDEQWGKINEITNPNHDKLSYRSFVDITGEGRKQMLLGFKTKDNPGELYGYTLRNGKTTELFNHKYNRIEVFNPPDNNGNLLKSQLAFWNKGNGSLDNIEVKHWDGNGLVPVNNQTNYYNKKVLPYYGQRVKQMPQDPSNWYKLADALTKAGMYRDGLDAVNIGMGLKPVSPSKEEFAELKSRIMENLKK